MTNMTFGDAPRNDGRSALVGYLLGKNKSGGKGGDGMSARDKASLMDRQHAQDIEKMAFGHTFGEKSAGSASRRQSAADRRKHKQGKDMVTHTETEKRTTSTSAAQDKRDTSTHHFDLLGQADGAKFGSMNLSSGSATFRTPPSGDPHPQKQGQQFSGTGDSSSTPPVNLDKL